MNLSGLDGKYISYIYSHRPKAFGKIRFYTKNSQKRPFLSPTLKKKENQPSRLQKRPRFFLALESLLNSLLSKFEVLSISIRGARSIVVVGEEKDAINLSTYRKERAVREWDVKLGWNILSRYCFFEN